MDITFKQWVKKFINEKNAVGDLARDIHADPTFPEENDKKAILGYLLPKAVPQAVMVFEKAWDAYSEG